MLYICDHVSISLLICRAVKIDSLYWYHFYVVFILVSLLHKHATNFLAHTNIVAHAKNSLHMQEVFKHTRNKLHIQEGLACAIKPACAGNYLNACACIR